MYKSVENHEVVATEIDWMFAILEKSIWFF